MVRPSSPAPSPPCRHPADLVDRLGHALPAARCDHHAGRPNRHCRTWAWVHGHDEMAAPSPLRGTVPHRPARTTRSSVALTTFSRADHPVRAALDHFGRYSCIYLFSGTDYPFDGVKYPFDGFYHPRLATKSPSRAMVETGSTGFDCCFRGCHLSRSAQRAHARHCRHHAGRVRARVLGVGFRRWRVFVWRRTIFGLPGN